MAEETTPQTCVNCGRTLVKQKGVWICLACNPTAIDTADIFVDPVESEVVEGVRWRDENDATKGFEIVGRPIYAPNHKHRRRVRKEAVGKIRRCRACQDYTIRMRRPEGRDFFIPSVRHPRRTRLRPMEHVTYEPH